MSFFYPSTPSMGKGRDGGEKKTGGEKRKKGGKKEKTDDYSGHYIIASSRPPDRRADCWNAARLCQLFGFFIM